MCGHKNFCDRFSKVKTNGQNQKELVQVQAQSSNFSARREQVKEFLDGELAKYETWKELKMTEKFFGHLFENQKAFTNAKREDKGKVGRDTILKFLGRTWANKSGAIQEALASIKSFEMYLDRKAVDMIPVQYQVKQFRKAVSPKKYNVPKSKQREIAEKIVEDKIGGREIPKVVRGFMPKPKREERDSEVQRMKEEMEKIDKKARSLCGTIIGLNAEMEKMKVKQLSGIKSYFAVDTIADLLPAVKELLKFFGFSFREVLLLKGRVK